MERDVLRNTRGYRPPEPDHFLQWGNTKRLRCVKAHVKDDRANNHERASTAARVSDRRTGSTIATTVSGKELPLPSHRVLRNSEGSPFGLRNLSNDHPPPLEKVGDRQNHHLAKASGSGRNGETMVTDKKMLNESQPKSNGSNGNGHHQNNQPFVWPKFIIGLSSKEKEEDFLAIKGSKLPQRPKKRSKFLQRTLNGGKNPRLVASGIKSVVCLAATESFEGKADVGGDLWKYGS